MLRANYILVVACILAVRAPAEEGAWAPQPGYERYHNLPLEELVPGNRRPDILSVTPRAHPGIAYEIGSMTAQERQSPTYRSTWDRTREGLLHAASFLLHYYRGEELYFLGRDGELLYDVARLLEPNNPRLHLIGVSRDSLRSPRLGDYLEQENLSNARLEQLAAAGRRAIVIDTGFRGTIPLTFSRRYSESARSALQVHLLARGSGLGSPTRASEMGEFPMTRLFALGAGASNRAWPQRYSSGEAMVTGLAHWVPKFYGPAHTYGPDPQRPGQLIPYYRREDYAPNENTARTDAARSLQFMEDIAYYLRLPESRRIHEQYQPLLSELRGLAANGSRAAVIARLIRHLNEGPAEGRPYREAFVRDWIDTYTRNPVDFRRTFVIGEEDIELSRESELQNNWQAVLSAHPEWQRFAHYNDVTVGDLRSPTHRFDAVVDTIKDLMIRRDFTLLRQLVETINDEVFRELFKRALESREGLTSGTRTALESSFAQSAQWTRVLTPAGGYGSCNFESLTR